MGLGGNVKQRRLAQQLTLAELAVKTGVSRAMLSEVEREAKSPTVKLVSQIAEGLGCTVADLLDEPRPNSGDRLQLVKQNERQVLVNPDSGAEKHLLAPRLVRRGLEVQWYTIPAGQKSGKLPPLGAGAEENLTVLKGRLICQVGEKEIKLEKGDSLTFPADIEREFCNPGPDNCRFFLLTLSAKLLG